MVQRMRVTRVEADGMTVEVVVDGPYNPYNPDTLDDMVARALALAGTSTPAVDLADFAHELHPHLMREQEAHARRNG